MRTLSSAVPEPRSVQPLSRRRSSGGGFVTAVLLAGVLFSGPLVLGGARLWFELPLFEVVTLILLVQALRLTRAAQARFDPIDLAVVAFTGYAAIRWLTSPTEYYSRLEILNIVAYTVIFFSCRYGLVRRTHGLCLLALLVTLGVFETGFGYYLNTHLDWCPFGPDETLHQFYAPRWVGTYGCPNHYGEILVMGMGAALAFACFSKLSWPVRIVFFYFAAVMLVGVVCSASRGSLLGACASIIALAVFGVRHGTLRWWIPPAGGLVLIGALVFGLWHSAVVQDRLDEVRHTFANGSLDTYVRVKLARDALRIAHDHPLFGTGPATFVFVHPRYQDITFKNRAVLTHDDYLNCLDDYGIAGFAVALFFVAAVTYRFFHRPGATSLWQDRVLLVAGFTAWAALVVHSFLDFNLHIPANALMLFALTGMGLRSFFAEDMPGFSLPARPLGWLLILFSLAYGYEVGRTALSDLIYEHAESQSQDALPSDLTLHTKEALHIDPDNVPALIFLGDLYRMQAARADNLNVRLAKGQKALDAYQQAVRDNPLDDSIEVSMGLTYDVLYRYSEAYFCYAQALAHQPYDGGFWFRLGNHFWERGLLEKAEQAYLMGLRCPNGAMENAEPAQEIRGYLAAEGIPLPAPGTNPLRPAVLPAERPTIP